MLTFFYSRLKFVEEQWLLEQGWTCEMRWTKGVTSLSILSYFFLLSTLFLYLFHVKFLTGIIKRTRNSLLQIGTDCFTIICCKNIIYWTAWLDVGTVCYLICNTSLYTPGILKYINSRPKGAFTPGSTSPSEMNWIHCPASEVSRKGKWLDVLGNISTVLTLIHFKPRSFTTFDSDIFALVNNLLCCLMKTNCANRARDFYWHIYSMPLAVKAWKRAIFHEGRQRLQCCVCASKKQKSQSNWNLSPLYALKIQSDEIVLFFDIKEKLIYS